MLQFRPHFRLPAETEIGLDDFLTDKQVHFVFDFANVFISAERLGYQIDFQSISERFPGIQKDVFITRRDLVAYGQRLKGYQVYASPGKNCDVEIALHLDSLKTNSSLKLVCFFGGDGDFHSVLARFEKHGVAIKCLSFESSFSARLLEVAEFIPIGKDFLKPFSRR
jgi:uncharacterized LabA/DUF88 family protein